jgi:anti-sigma B factor antagonist
MSNPDWIKLTNHGTQIVLAPVGEIAYVQATEFRAALRKAFDLKPSKIVVNLSQVDYMNTPGLATLVEALQISGKVKVALVLCCLNEKVQAIFDIARLNTVFKITPTVEAALV